MPDLIGHLLSFWALPVILSEAKNLSKCLVQHEQDDVDWKEQNLYEDWSVSFVCHSSSIFVMTTKV